MQHLLKPDPLLPDDLRPRWQRILFTPARWILDLAFSSLAAWIGSIPLAAYYFHIITPISTLANIVAVPLCGFVLTCNSASLLLAGWFPAAAAIFNYFGWLFMKWIHETSIWFANWPHAYAYIAAPSLFTILVYYSILLALATGWFFEAKWRKWKFIALIFLLAIWSAQWLHDRSVTRITILPLNGGSAVYCDAPDRKNDLLINCGNDNAVEFVMKPYLRAQGVNTLPTFALTHGAAQQIGGFEKFQALFPIEKVVTSSVQFRSPAYRQILDLLDATPGRRQIVNPSDAFRNWTVLHPAATNHFPRADDNALVARADFGRTRILFLSDLARSGQDALLSRNPDLHADIVIAGLPDQGEPLNDALLAAINPRLIVIADSKSPATKRTTRALRERLETHGALVLCTSETGAIKISLRKNEWHAQTADGQFWSPISKM
jgi:competence protein ComEC